MTAASYLSNFLGKKELNFFYAAMLYRARGKSMSSSSKKLAALLALLFFVSCGPAPRRELSDFERQTDLYWLFSQFEQNYAPLEYKQQLWQFDYELHKANTLTKSQKSQALSNEDFYLQAHAFVAKFADAHTSAQLTPASLPARAKVAYLGFSGLRKGDGFIVTDFLPTYKVDPNSLLQFPIKLNDVVLEIDGKSLKEYYTDHLKTYKNLGNEEANYTAFFATLFRRSSLYEPMPKEVEVELKVKRGEDELIITLPWVKKDLYVFNQEQNDALKIIAPVTPTTAGGVDQRLAFHLKCFDQRGLFSYKQCPEAKSFLRNHAEFSFWNTFKRPQNNLEWIISPVSVDGKITTEVVDPLKALKEKRFVPTDAIFVQHSGAYPAYLTRQKDANDQYFLIGVIHLDTFSPAGAEKDVIKEFKDTLKAFKGLGVTKLIIDTVNNGGGSLTLGMGLAQSLSSQKIEMPSMQFRLSESWLDSFERESLFGLNDTTKQINLGIFNALQDDFSKGDWLSRSFKATSLMSTALELNNDLKDHQFETLLLVNEICASMCDIFAGILQDNKLAKVMGVQTMGAGGNVVMHGVAPNSGLLVSQTESLIIRSNGEFLENNGVKPDVEFVTNTSADTKFDKVLQAAFLEVLK